MTESKICTCPSGDGSLVHPCPAHPAVEQAGGDERVIGWRERILAAHPNSDPGFWPDALLVEHMAAEIADLRAALAQPSPAQTQPSPAPTLRAAIDVANDRFEVPVAKWGTDLVGEEERPEVAEVAFVLRNIGAMDAEDIDGDNVDLRFEDAEGRDTGCDVSIVEYAEKAADLFEQHDRIVGELRADRDSWAEQAEQRLADWDEMRKERDAALARVAELERKLRNEENAHTTTIEQRDNAEHWADQLANAIAERFGVDIGEHSNLNCPWNEALVWMQQPPAQAQHSVPEGVTIERDVAGTIHIKVGDFDFIQLQYQRPYTDNASTWKLAERIASLLAAAPSKEGL
ncbi:TPA: hypothetical protein L5D19_000644 [Pseudomonas aeruginosa]|nr:hypothetical protein [Pseudomonas aeruginosa]HBO9263277.1 hypothetical protein [Pseudomonas aeruginosa]